MENKVKVAIVEDEEFWRKKISEIIGAHYKDYAEIDEFGTGEAFLSENKAYDIIFMDIEMKEKDGFETIEEYRKSFKGGLILILTTHKEMCSRGYKVEAFRYLDKSMIDEIKEAINDADKKLKLYKSIKLHQITFGDIYLNVRDIICIETVKRKVLVHTVHLGKFECSDKINTLAEELKNDGFYEVHRSYLINMDYVLDYNNKQVRLKNEIIAYMSIRKYRDFKTAFMKWRFERGNG